VLGLGVVPVRCFTCGAVIGDKWDEFTKRVKEGQDPGMVLNELGVKRYCCRSMLLSHVNIFDEVLKYYNVKGERG